MEKIQSWNGRVYETRVSVQPGTFFELQFSSTDPAMFKVRAKGAGVSALVEYCTSPSEMLAAGTADFDPAPIGENGLVADAVAGDEILAPLTALRVTAMGGPVIVEMLQ